MMSNDPTTRSDMASQLHTSLTTVVTVVLVTVTMYAAFLSLSRLMGPRALATVSAFEFAAVIAVGAVIGRTALLATPTLLIGLTALVTLFGLRALLGVVALHPTLDLVVNGRPVLLVIDGVLLRERMRRAHVHEREIRLALRRAGVLRLADVTHVVLERDGSLSVLRGPTRPDEWLVADVPR
jgi:uncharacterized membrane protein YcaP (DUF421 family)